MTEMLQVTIVDVKTGERVTLTLAGALEVVGWAKEPSSTPETQMLIHLLGKMEDLSCRVADVERQGIPDKPRDGREYWFNQETREWVPYRPRM